MNSNQSPTFLALAAVVTALIAVSTLSGCSSARRSLGLEKATPDEFAVTAGAPLAQPPDFSLRPPSPGAPRPQQGTTTEQARAAVMGSPGSGAPTASPGEKVLLTKSNAVHNEPDVRRKVDEETTGLAIADHSFTNRLLFWQDAPDRAVVLDSDKEAKRLKDNATAGKAPTEGVSPTISRGGSNSSGSTGGSSWDWLPSLW